MANQDELTLKECLGESCKWFKSKPDATCFKQGVLPRCSPSLKAKKKAQLAKLHRDRPKFNNALEADAHNWDERELDRPDREKIAELLKDIPSDKCGVCDGTGWLPDPPESYFNRHHCEYCDGKGITPSLKTRLLKADQILALTKDELLNAMQVGLDAGVAMERERIVGELELLNANKIVEGHSVLSFVVGWSALKGDENGS